MSSSTPVTSSHPGTDLGPDQNIPNITSPGIVSENLSENLSKDLANEMTEGMDEITSAEATQAKAIVSQYFDTLNAEAFQATADLFAEDGVLHPPFESAVIGREAIVQYLETEARGLRLTPIEHLAEHLENGNVQYKVTGKVQTPLFGVNVGWTFILNSAAEILSVQVKLLAALEELFKLKSTNSTVQLDHERG